MGGAALGFLKGIAVFGLLSDWLGPWGAAAVIAVVFVGLFVLARSLPAIFMWVLTREAKKLGKTLESAEITVHSIVPATVPDDSIFGDDDEDREFNQHLDDAGVPEGDYEWYHVDLTIRPQANPDEPAGVQWEPDSLRFARQGESGEAFGFDIDCLTVQQEWWEKGRFVKKEHATATNEQRLRLYAGFKPGMRSATLTYLGNPLLDVQLPTNRVLATARG